MTDDAKPSIARKYSPTTMVSACSATRLRLENLVFACDTKYGELRRDPFDFGERRVHVDGNVRPLSGCALEIPAQDWRPSTHVNFDEPYVLAPPVAQHDAAVGGAASGPIRFSPSIATKYRSPA